MMRPQPETARVGEVSAPRAAGPPAVPRAGRHIPALDAIRGLAILLVLAYHFNIGPNPLSAAGRGLFALVRAGGLGVDLFFVLSGFLITGILHDSRRDRHYFRDFYIRRTLRIFPLYYATLLLAFVVLPLLGAAATASYESSVSHQFWLWTYLANVFLGVREAYVLDGFNHFWSLAVEEHFYLAWPIVIFVCDRRRAMTVCLACIVAALGCRLGLALAGHHPISAYVLTPCRMDALATGAWLALAIRGSGGLAPLLTPARISLVTCGLVASPLFVWKSGDSQMDVMTLVLRPSLSSWLFGTLLVLALAAAPGGWWGWFWNGRFLRFFGKYSYGLYVFHYPLIPLFKTWFSPETLAFRTGSPVLGRLVFMILASTLTVAAALVSWNLFEKHLVKLKDRLTGRGPVVRVESGGRVPARVGSRLAGELGPPLPSGRMEAV